MMAVRAIALLVVELARTTEEWLIGATNNKILNNNAIAFAVALL